MQLKIKNLGDYEVEGEIGKGGMGSVYRGRHQITGRHVAIKVISPELGSDPAFLERFHREVKALQLLKHPNIIDVYDVGKQNGNNYYVMEYIGGGSLADEIKKRRIIDVDDAIDLTIQIAEALGHAHESNIIHRDIKPANVLLDTKGKVKLGDFGIARLLTETKMTMTGEILGTVDYMSPEQAEGRRVSNRSDIYSLGVVLYQMLTGRLPFTGKTPMEIMHKHRFALPESPKRLNPSLPINLVKLVDKMLEKDPLKRFSNVKVLLRELRKIKSQRESMRIRENGEPATSETAATSILNDNSATIVLDEKVETVPMEQFDQGTKSRSSKIIFVLACFALLAAAFSIIMNSKEQRLTPKESLELASDLISQSSEAEMNSREDEAKAKEKEAIRILERVIKRYPNTQWEKKARDFRDPIKAKLKYKDAIGELEKTRKLTILKLRNIERLYDNTEWAAKAKRKINELKRLTKRSGE